MPLDSDEFRRVMGHLVSGVTVVSAWDPGADAPCGLTANAVCSVSLDPLLVLACVDRGADSHDGILAAGAFSISILAQDQERLSRRFSHFESGEKFDGVAFRRAETGSPVLDDALAWVDCRTWAEYPGGDHTIIVGEVVAAETREGGPLVFYRGGYGRFTP